MPPDIFTYHRHTKQRLGPGLSLGNLAFRGLDGVCDSHIRNFVSIERTLNHGFVISFV
ncbi:uncharacterized protein AFUA_1G12360 [Aspergillus fumigatus Af293]|uniref:Uncharacterized protein n=2 Tax=Aspergillus fumigatus TaxID=746128 RepID=Q4WSL5_ASPFU|nr:hypothetical protein AFUA_1G12360 [Aspergillus fumigatus Af293]EAL90567.1 hypothetical protein AFUA_1G12360 [Aspergillus fumigatus Af293]EDP56472.1 hypothetical protein AFUB_011830 [Aspergillus fumigatus A1163]